MNNSKTTTPEYYYSNTYPTALPEPVISDTGNSSYHDWSRYRKKFIFVTSDYDNVIIATQDLSFCKVFDTKRIDRIDLQECIIDEYDAEVMTRRQLQERLRGVPVIKTTMDWNELSPRSGLGHLSQMIKVNFAALELCSFNLL